MKRIYKANCKQEASDLAKDQGYKVIFVELLKKGTYIVHTEEK